MYMKNERILSGSFVLFIVSKGCFDCVLLVVRLREKKNFLFFNRFVDGKGGK